jgi:hypothetical protein
MSHLAGKEAMRALTEERYAMDYGRISSGRVR